ncbi:cloacin immunity family protein [Pseudomonas corrugata]|nr:MULTISPECIES: colicin E3-like toxin immunity protein [Pseudomonas]MDU9038883.1 colicin E3-like toxin immunity protein [Pseudomonas corrugata]UZD98448.1 cloacin immunity family protein [Pseudomonas corrugata]
MAERKKPPGDFGEDGTVVELLEIPLAGNINNGGLDVRREWIETLQPHFQHAIDWHSYD